jgi:hypothetical protein
MSKLDTAKAALLFQVRLWTCGLLWEPRKLRNKLPRRRKATTWETREVSGFTRQPKLWEV